MINRSLPRGGEDVKTTFSNLPTGTTHWAVTDFSQTDISLEAIIYFKFTAVGNSGTSEYWITLTNGAHVPKFMGFSDPAGLISVSLTHFRANGAVFDYEVPAIIDDVITAGPHAVPEPSSLALFGVAATVFAGRSFTRRRGPAQR